MSSQLEAFEKLFATKREASLYREAERWRRKWLDLVMEQWVARGHKDEQGNPCLPPDDPGPEGEPGCSSE